MSGVTACSQNGDGHVIRATTTSTETKIFHNNHRNSSIRADGSYTHDSNRFSANGSLGMGKVVGMRGAKYVSLNKCEKQEEPSVSSNADNFGLANESGSRMYDSCNGRSQLTIDERNSSSVKVITTRGSSHRASACLSNLFQENQFGLTYLDGNGKSSSCSYQREKLDSTTNNNKLYQNKAVQPQRQQQQPWLCHRCSVQLNPKPRSASFSGSSTIPIEDTIKNRNRRQLNSISEETTGRRLESSNRGLPLADADVTTARGGSKRDGDTVSRIVVSSRFMGGFGGSTTNQRVFRRCDREQEQERMPIRYSNASNNMGLVGANRHRKQHDMGFSSFVGREQEDRPRGLVRPDIGRGLLRNTPNGYHNNRATSYKSSLLFRDQPQQPLQRFRERARAGWQAYRVAPASAAATATASINHVRAASQTFRQVKHDEQHELPSTPLRGEEISNIDSFERRRAIVDGGTNIGNCRSSSSCSGDRENNNNNNCGQIISTADYNNKIYNNNIENIGGSSSSSSSCKEKNNNNRLSCVVSGRSVELHIEDRGKKSHASKRKRLKRRSSPLCAANTCYTPRQQQQVDNLKIIEQKSTPNLVTNTSSSISERPNHIGDSPNVFLPKIPQNDRAPESDGNLFANRRLTLSSSSTISQSSTTRLSVNSTSVERLKRIGNFTRQHDRCDPISAYGDKQRQSYHRQRSLPSTTRRGSSIYHQRRFRSPDRSAQVDEFWHRPTGASGTENRPMSQQRRPSYKTRSPTGHTDYQHHSNDVTRRPSLSGDGGGQRRRQQSPQMGDSRDRNGRSFKGSSQQQQRVDDSRDCCSPSSANNLHPLEVLDQRARMAISIYDPLPKPSLLVTIQVDGVKSSALRIDSRWSEDELIENVRMQMIELDELFGGKLRQRRKKNRASNCSGDEQPSEGVDQVDGCSDEEASVGDDDNESSLFIEEAQCVAKLCQAHLIPSSSLSSSSDFNGGLPSPRLGDCWRLASTSGFVADPGEANGMMGLESVGYCCQSTSQSQSPASNTSSQMVEVASRQSSAMAAATPQQPTDNDAENAKLESSAKLVTVEPPTAEATSTAAPKIRSRGSSSSSDAAICRPVSKPELGLEHYAPTDPKPPKGSSSRQADDMDRQRQQQKLHGGARVTFASIAAAGAANAPATKPSTMAPTKQADPLSVAVGHRQRQPSQPRRQRAEHAAPEKKPQEQHLGRTLSQVQQVDNESVSEEQPVDTVSEKMSQQLTMKETTAAATTTDANANANTISPTPQTATIEQTSTTPTTNPTPLTYAKSVRFNRGSISNPTHTVVSSQGAAAATTTNSLMVAKDATNAISSTNSGGRRQHSTPNSRPTMSSQASRGHESDSTNLQQPVAKHTSNNGATSDGSTAHRQARQQQPSPTGTPNKSSAGGSDRPARRTTATKPAAGVSSAASSRQSASPRTGRAADSPSRAPSSPTGSVKRGQQQHWSPRRLQRQTGATNHSSGSAASATSSDQDRRGSPSSAAATAAISPGSELAAGGNCNPDQLLVASDSQQTPPRTKLGPDQQQQLQLRANGPADKAEAVAGDWRQSPGASSKRANLDPVDQSGETVARRRQQPHRRQPMTVAGDVVAGDAIAAPAPEAATVIETGAGMATNAASIAITGSGSRSATASESQSPSAAAATDGNSSSSSGSGSGGNSGPLLPVPSQANDDCATQVCCCSSVLPKSAPTKPTKAASGSGNGAAGGKGRSPRSAGSKLNSGDAAGAGDGDKGSGWRQASGGRKETRAAILASCPAAAGNTEIAALAGSQVFKTTPAEPSDAEGSSRAAGKAGVLCSQAAAAATFARSPTASAADDCDEKKPDEAGECEANSAKADDENKRGAEKWEETATAATATIQNTTATAIKCTTNCNQTSEGKSQAASLLSQEQQQASRMLRQQQQQQQVNSSNGNSNYNSSSGGGGYRKGYRNRNSNSLSERNRNNSDISNSVTLTAAPATQISKASLPLQAAASSCALVVALAQQNSRRVDNIAFDRKKYSNNNNNNNTNCNDDVNIIEQPIQSNRKFASTNGKQEDQEQQQQATTLSSTKLGDNNNSNIKNNIDHSFSSNSCCAGSGIGMGGRKTANSAIINVSSPSNQSNIMSQRKKAQSNQTNNNTSIDSSNNINHQSTTLPNKNPWNNCNSNHPSTNTVKSINSQSPICLIKDTVEMTNGANSDTKGEIRDNTISHNDNCTSIGTSLGSGIVASNATTTPDGVDINSNNNNSSKIIQNKSNLIINNFDTTQQQQITANESNNNISCSQSNGCNENSNEKDVEKSNLSSKSSLSSASSRKPQQDEGDKILSEKFDRVLTVDDQKTAMIKESKQEVGPNDTKQGPALNNSSSAKSNQGATPNRSNSSTSTAKSSSISSTEQVVIIDSDEIRNESSIVPSGSDSKDSTRLDKVNSETSSNTDKTTTTTKQPEETTMTPTSGSTPANATTTTPTNTTIPTTTITTGTTNHNDATQSELIDNNNQSETAKPQRVPSQPPANNRSVLILREIDPNSSESSVMEIFNSEKCPSKPVHCEYALHNSWYVTFKNNQDAKLALTYIRYHIDTWNGQPLYARYKSIPAVPSATNQPPPNIVPPLVMQGAGQPVAGSENGVASTAVSGNNVSMIGNSPVGVMGPAVAAQAAGPMMNPVAPNGAPNTPGLLPYHHPHHHHQPNHSMMHHLHGGHMVPHAPHPHHHPGNGPPPPPHHYGYSAVAYYGQHGPIMTPWHYSNAPQYDLSEVFIYNGLTPYPSSIKHGSNNSNGKMSMNNNTGGGVSSAALLGGEQLAYHQQQHNHHHHHHNHHHNNNGNHHHNHHQAAHHHHANSSNNSLMYGPQANGVKSSPNQRNHHHNNNKSNAPIIGSNNNNNNNNNGLANHHLNHHNQSASSSHSSSSAASSSSQHTGNGGPKRNRNTVNNRNPAGKI